MSDNTSDKRTPYTSQDEERFREIIRAERRRLDRVDRPFIKEMSRELFLLEIEQHLKEARLKLDKRHASCGAKMEMALRELEEAPDPKPKS